MSAVEGTEAGTTETSSKTRQPWFIVLLVLCPVLLVYAALRQHPYSDLAYAIGFFIPSALIVAAVTWLCSRSARDRKGIVFASVFASLMVGNYLGVLHERQQASSFLDSVQSTTEAYANDAIGDPASVPKPIELKPAVATTSGDVGAAEVVIKELFNDFAASRNAYLAELQAVGWYTLLDAKRLKTDASLADSWSTIKGGERIVRKYQQRSMEMIEAMPDKVRQSKLESEGMRASMVRGFEASLPKARQNTKELWDLELAAFREMRGIFELLERRRGHYNVTDTQILFETNTDLAAYNAHLEAMTEIGRKQAAAQRRMQAEGVKTLEQTRAGL